MGERQTLWTWAVLALVFVVIPVLFGLHINAVEAARSPENNGYHCWTQSKSQGSDIYIVCVKNLGPDYPDPYPREQ